MSGAIPPLLKYVSMAWCSVQAQGQLYLTSLSSLLQPAITSSLLGANTLLSTLFSHTLNLCSSLRVRNRISHPYKKQVFREERIGEETGRQETEQNSSKHSPHLFCS
jgi:hypothetical protein